MGLLMTVIQASMHPETAYYVDADKFTYGDIDDSGTDCDDPARVRVSGRSIKRIVMTAWQYVSGCGGVWSDEVDSDCDGGGLQLYGPADDGYAVSSGATVVSADADCQDLGEASSSDGAGIVIPRKRPIQVHLKVWVTLTRIVMVERFVMPMRMMTVTEPLLQWMWIVRIGRSDGIGDCW